MALTITRITVGTPTLDDITLGAGGSLAVGTTYYYRLIAVRRYEDKHLYCLSAASEEKSVTPTSGNQTAQLTWTAVTNATSYIIQRTTTSGSYPVGGNNTFGLGGGQPYVLGYYSTSLTYLDDDGGASSNVRFSSLNQDFDTELPIIEVTGSGMSDVATLYAIASSLAGSGYNDLYQPGTSRLLENSTYRDQGPYILRGSILYKNCSVRIRSALIGIPGGIYVSEASGEQCKIEIGHATNNYNPFILALGLPSVCVTNNNNTFSSIYYGGCNIAGKSGETNIVRRLFERPLTYDTVGMYACMTRCFYTMFDPFSNCDVSDGTLGATEATGNAFHFAPKTASNLFLDSLCLFGSLSNTTIYCSIYINAYNDYNTILDTCVKAQHSANGSDIVPWWSTTGGSIIAIDCQWKTRGQTDNQPYISYGWQQTSLNRRNVVFANRVKFEVTDADNGNPIDGAQIYLVNNDGLSGFWMDSGATLSSSYNETSDPVSFTVSDGTKFFVGDYIRHECYQEVLKITNISANTITAARAQLGTIKCLTVYQSSGGYNKRILKMINSIETDSGGKAIPSEPTLQRVLYPASGSDYQNNWENNLVSNGYYQRLFFGPYELTVSKAGYKSYEAKILDPNLDKFPIGSQTIRISLSKIKDLNFSKYVKRVSQ